MHPGPSFTFVLPVYRSPLVHLRQQIDALAAQTYPNFTVVVVDDGCPQHTGGIVGEWVAGDERFTVITREHNGGIAVATNTGLDAATGDFVIFVDHDDRIDRRALDFLAASIASHPDTDLLYTDEDLIDEEGQRIAVYAKPDWSPDRLLGQPYINHLTCIRRTLLSQERLRSELEPSQDYDLLLRITPAARRVGHVAKVLYSWRAVEGSTAKAATEKRGVGTAVLRAVTETLARRGIDAKAVPVEGDPNCVTVVRPATPATVDRIDIGGGVRAIDRAIRSSAADVVVLWDGADEAATIEGQDALVAQAMRADVGCVGPLIVSADDRLVSAGRVHRPQLDDPLSGDPATAPGPWGAFQITREVSSVRPLGLAVERRAYLAAGGLPIAEDRAADDLDVAVAVLSTRLTARGQRTLWTPQCVIRTGTAWKQVDTSLRLRRIDLLHRWAVTDPGLLEETFDPTGVGAAVETSTATQSPYTTVIGRLASGAVDLLTSDVFDTLVWRPVARPHHLWVRWAEQMIAAGELADTADPAMFAKARTEAEHRARQINFRQSEQVECTIEEIWAQMPDIWVIGDRSAMIRREISVEASVLRPYDDAVRILDEAKRLGIPVVLVSDTYFSADQLGELLGRVGVPMDGIERVVTSSTVGIGKWQGLVRTAIGSIEPERVLHIGDNEHADYEAARGAGAAAVHLDIAAASNVTDRAREPIVHYSGQRGTDASVTAAIRTTLMRSGSPTPAYQFGAALAGPLVTGFATWAADTAAALGVPTLHCLLREGKVIADIAGRVRPHTETRLVQASRWVTMRAAVVEGTEDELTEALARRARLRAEHVTEAFGIDIDRVRAVIGSGQIEHGDRDEVVAALAADDEIRAEIVAASQRIRRRVMRYLEATLDLGAERLVVCDIGWGGTIQVGLERILEAEGYPIDVTGLYLLLSPAGVARTSRGFDLRGYLANDGLDPRLERTAATLSRNPEILERITTPRLGTLIDIDDDGQPVNRADDFDQHAPSLEAAQRGLSDFVDTLVEIDGVPPAHPWSDDPSWRAALGESLAKAISTPHPALAADLADWQHDDVAGTGSSTLVDGPVTADLPYLNVVDASGVGMDEVFWLPGLAAIASPALAAQIAAVELGVDAEALSPPSELGSTLVAVFPAGDEAAAQWRGVPRQNVAGWSFVKLTGNTPGIRTIRLDLGEHAGVVRCARLQIEAVVDGGERWEIATADLHGPGMRWTNAHPLGPSLTAIGEESMLLINPPAEWLHRPCKVSVTIAFGGWRIEGLKAPAAVQLREAAQRLLAQAKRRLPFSSR